MKQVVLGFLFLLCVLVGCATSVQERPASSQTQIEAFSTAAQPPALLEFNATNYTTTGAGGRIDVRQMEVKDHLGDLPLYLHLRLGLLQAQDEEWNETMAGAGRDASAPFDWGPSVWGFLSYYQASDGIEFLLDHVSMALWFRTEKQPWTCALSQVNVIKTFGGVHPRLPVCYVGSKRFLVAETLPGRREKGAQFPQARCATFLIDCESGRVVDRTGPVIYDHNPPLVLPKDWETKYDIQVEPSSGPSRR